MWTKLITVLLASLAIIGFIIFVIYKPMYSVSFNGEEIGYTENKGDLQDRINEYIKEGDSKTVAFVEVETMPEYRMCLLKKGLVANDDEIFDKIKQSGIVYYKYYAVLDDGEEKAYVSDFSQAESVINQLKEKDSDNIDNISIMEMYDTEVKDLLINILECIVNDMINFI